jgi:hypothetical protein
MPLSTLSRETCCACRWLNDWGAVWQSVYKVVAIIVDPIAHLRIAIRHANISVACVPDAVEICIFLASIDHLGAVITGIADAILILVSLIRIRDIWAVVINATETIVIRVEADTTQ